MILICLALLAFGLISRNDIWVLTSGLFAIATSINVLSSKFGDNVNK